MKKIIFAIVGLLFISSSSYAEQYRNGYRKSKIEYNKNFYDFGFNKDDVGNNSEEPRLQVRESKSYKDNQNQGNGFKVRDRNRNSHRYNTREMKNHQYRDRDIKSHLYKSRSMGNSRGTKSFRSSGSGMSRSNSRGRR